MANRTSGLMAKLPSSPWRKCFCCPPMQAAPPLQTSFASEALGSKLHLLGATSKAETSRLPSEVSGHQ